MRHIKKATIPSHGLSVRGTPKPKSTQKKPRGLARDGRWAPARGRAKRVQGPRTAVVRVSTGWPVGPSKRESQAGAPPEDGGRSLNDPQPRAAPAPLAGSPQPNMLHMPRGRPKRKRLATSTCCTRPEECQNRSLQAPEAHWRRPGRRLRCRSASVQNTPWFASATPGPTQPTDQLTPHPRSPPQPPTPNTQKHIHPHNHSHLAPCGLQPQRQTARPPQLNASVSLCLWPCQNR